MDVLMTATWVSAMVVSGAIHGFVDMAFTENG